MITCSPKLGLSMFFSFLVSFSYLAHREWPQNRGDAPMKKCLGQIWDIQRLAAISVFLFLVTRVCPDWVPAADDQDSQSPNQESTCISGLHGQHRPQLPPSFATLTRCQDEFKDLPVSQSVSQPAGLIGWKSIAK
ncbi:hypothetical protein GGR58DRAFT_478284 [Xylaria digitata]|nr:hypothetical protein GGR58DRAFT_478284 [Xylaria digitata]